MTKKQYKKKEGEDETFLKDPKEKMNLYSTAGMTKNVLIIKYDIAMQRSLCYWKGIQRWHPNNCHQRFSTPMLVTNMSSLVGIFSQHFPGNTH